VAVDAGRRLQKKLLWLGIPARWLGCWLLIATIASAQSSAERALEDIRREKDTVDRRAFLQLVNARDERALERILLVPPLLADEDTLASAYGSLTWFLRTELEERAVSYLMREALHGRSPAHQHSATRALARCGDVAVERLERIARTHDNATCRSLALTPLLPRFVGTNDAATLRLLLRAATLAPEQQSGVAALLGQFRDREAQRLLAERAKDAAASEAWRVLAVDCLAAIEGEYAAAALRESGLASRGAAQLRALKVLAERDPEAALIGLRRLVEVGDEAEATEAILTLSALRDASPDWVEELGRIARSASTAARMATVSALARVRTRESLHVLHETLGDPDWRVQLLAVQAVNAFREKDSLPRLIAALAGARRRVADEILLGLRLATGVDHGRSAAAWDAWWRAEGRGFELVARDEGLRREREREARRTDAGGPRTATFYGLKLESDRVGFVIDISRSMGEPAFGERSSTGARTKLDVAKEQLTGLLAALVGDVHFNIVAFSTRVWPWRNSLVQLSEGERDLALSYVRGLALEGGTAIYDGLDRALADPDVDTLYVLTDGEPSGGTVTRIDQIRELIGEKARTRLVRIHGVAVGEPSVLLEGLALDTGGQYRFVP
jgi:hypothetical protein